jgi:hypothetical protein
MVAHWRFMLIAAIRKSQRAARATDGMSDWVKS